MQTHQCQRDSNSIILVNAVSFQILTQDPGKGAVAGGWWRPVAARPVVLSYQTYLGRPWQQYSQIVVLKSYIDRLVNLEGWLRWQNSNFTLSTSYYGEYRNFGPGASARSRVKWSGYHVITNRNVASRFTVSSLIAGRTWLPSAGVPFNAGL